MTRDNEDSLLRSVALQNAESIRALRLRAEQQAEASLREQASLLNLTHDAIFVRDMNGTVKYWNRGAEELYGWPVEQAVGSVILELLRNAARKRECGVVIVSHDNRVRDFVDRVVCLEDGRLAPDRYSTTR